MTVYYIPPYDGKTMVKAFQPVSKSFLKKLQTQLTKLSRVSECSLEIRDYVRRKNFEEAVE